VRRGKRAMGLWMGGEGKKCSRNKSGKERLRAHGSGTALGGGDRPGKAYGKTPKGIGGGC